MAVKEYTLTADGGESHFGVNYIGHFLLTNLLMDKLVTAKTGARIINVSSFEYLTSGIRDDWNFKVRFSLSIEAVDEETERAV